MLQPHNGIYILTWYDDMQDNALTSLTPLLEELLATRAKVPAILEKYKEQIPGWAGFEQYSHNEFSEFDIDDGSRPGPERVEARALAPQHVLQVPARAAAPWHQTDSPGHHDGHREETRLLTGAPTGTSHDLNGSPHGTSLYGSKYAQITPTATYQPPARTGYTQLGHAPLHGVSVSHHSAQLADSRDKLTQRPQSQQTQPQQSHHQQQQQQPQSHPQPQQQHHPHMQSLQRPLHQAMLPSRPQVGHGPFSTGLTGPYQVSQPQPIPAGSPMWGRGGLGPLQVPRH